MMKFVVRFFAFLIFLSLSARAYAQNINVTLTVTTRKNEAVPFATFTVVNRIDSLLSQKKISDSSGVVTFMLEKNIQYVVRITSVNYQSLEKGIMVTSAKNSFSFIADDLSKTLQRVTVSSTRPIMRQEDDKTVVDPEPMAAASTNAYEILEKT
ncbi:MAG TPA: hypothetical protein VFP87_10385, partial [Chitinophagaceae bacterium]|nr:hypothetical protein [Chitinophagaceae bacterium]